MEGLIQESMARPQGEELTLESVKQNIKMPPELQEAYERVVIAGMKVMFDQNTHRAMLREITKPGPMGDKLGQGVAGLLLMLVKEGNNTMPPAVLIPAGLELIMQAVDFVRRAELGTVTNEDIGRAAEVMITTLMGKFGADPARLEQVLNQFDNAGVDAAAQQMGGAPAPAAPEMGGAA